MNLGLTDSVALVTGASSGIGAAVASLLAEEGADVVVAFDRNESGARDTAREVESRGRRAWLTRMNVGDPGSVAGAVDRLRSAPGRLDRLILCAGKNVLTPWTEITPEEWNDVIGVNLSGAFYVIQACVPLMSDGGAIVTVASVAARTGAPHHLHYAAAKAGLVNLTRSFARALAPRIRVNCVAPGLTLTPMGQATMVSLPEDYPQRKIPLGRFAQPDEIARCIVFVASPVAGFMTGTTIDVDGGRALGG
jgi:3-oxoacyl-[acyl-carrier protein] reductase